MKKKLLTIALAFALLSSLCIFVPVSAETGDVVWTNGSPEEWDNGFTKIVKSDTRANIAAPDLDNGPYYMMMGMDGLMPGGSEEEGGRWAQLHISGVERDSNSNPAGDIYISVPNANARPRNITVYTRTDGEKKLAGVHFAVLTANVFKFVKEQNGSGDDVLAIYCNGTKVFEGADQLSIFSGDRLYFNAIGNSGEYDTFTDYPMFVDFNAEFISDPLTAFYTGPKWGTDQESKPAADIMVTYTPDGSAKMIFMSDYEAGIIGQSISSTFFNNRKKFDMFIELESFNYESWQLIGFRPGSRSGAPADEPDTLNIEISSGPTLQIFYWSPERERIYLFPPTQFEMNTQVKLHFEVVNTDGVNTVEVYIDDVLVAKNDDADLVALMKSHMLKMVATGHNSLIEIPCVTYVRIDNNPAEFTPLEPGGDNNGEEEDPNSSLVLTSSSDKVTVSGSQIAVSGSMKVAQLYDSLNVPDGCVAYIMNKNEETADRNDTVDSTYSIMLLMDDEFETYVRTYTINAGGSGQSSSDGGNGSGGGNADSGSSGNGNSGSGSSGNGSGGQGNSNTPSGKGPDTGEHSFARPAMILLIVSVTLLLAILRKRLPIRS